MGGRRWSEDDLIYLEYFVYANDARLSIAAEYLGRSTVSVMNKLSKMRKKDSNVQYIGRPWSKEEDDFLVRYYTSMTNDNIAQKLRRTSKAVGHRATRLGVTNPICVQKFDGEIRKLISEGYCLNQICEKLGIKKGSLYSYVRRTGIEYKKKRFDYRNHPWSKQNHAHCQEYLNENRGVKP